MSVQEALNDAALCAMALRECDGGRRYLLRFRDVTANTAQCVTEQIGQFDMERAPQRDGDRFQSVLNRHAEVAVELVTADRQLLAEAEAP